MTEHTLKIMRRPFLDLESGAKTGEVRDCSDRAFGVGDTVRLHLVDETGNPTGKELVRTITHIQHGFGLPDDLCVLSYAPQPPALGGEPEVIAYVCHGAPGNAGVMFSYLPIPEGFARKIDLIDRAHVAPLLADIERLSVLAEHNAQCFGEMMAERDTLKAQNEKLEDDLNNSGEMFTAQVRVVRGLHADIDALKTRSDELEKIGSHIVNCWAAAENGQMPSAMAKCIPAMRDALAGPTEAAPAAKDGE